MDEARSVVHDRRFPARLRRVHEERQRRRGLHEGPGVDGGDATGHEEASRGAVSSGTGEATDVSSATPRAVVPGFGGVDESAASRIDGGDDLPSVRHAGVDVG